MAKNQNFLTVANRQIRSMPKAKRIKKHTTKHTKKSGQKNSQKKHSQKKSHVQNKSKKSHHPKLSQKKSKKIKSAKTKKLFKPHEPKVQTIILDPITLNIAFHDVRSVSSTFEIMPDLNKLPPWESRQTLKNLIFNHRLKFFSISRASSEFQKALQLLGTTPMEDVSGHFVVCIKNSSNQIVGAIDGYEFEDVIVLGRSFVSTEKKRDFQLLLYSAAMTNKDAKYIVCSTKLEKVSVDFMGMLLLLGRGFGMYALPPFGSDQLIFIRRMQSEGPLSTGPEVAHMLRALRMLGGSDIRSAVFDFNQKGLVSLIPLPTSLDRKENIYEIKEIAPDLGLSEQSLKTVLSLLTQSAISYKDLTPDTLF
ncbi:MAG: hypothetical protein ABID61_01905 [Candidatus Micrarchaeota archaeon]